MQHNYWTEVQDWLWEAVHPDIREAVLYRVLHRVYHTVRGPVHCSSGLYFSMLTSPSPRLSFNPKFKCWNFLYQKAYSFTIYLIYFYNLNFQKLYSVFFNYWTFPLNVFFIFFVCYLCLYCRHCLHFLMCLPRIRSAGMSLLKNVLLNMMRNVGQRRDRSAQPTLSVQLSMITSAPLATGLL